MLPHVILIVIDALNAKKLGCYGFAHSISPNIDNFAKKAIMFRNAFSCATQTDPSITTILTGEHPVAHNVLVHSASLKELAERTRNLTFLPEILRSWGYLTVGIDWLGRWFKRGFMIYSDVSANSARSRVLNSVREIYLTTTTARTRKLFEKLRYSQLVLPLLAEATIPPAAEQTDLAIKLIEKYSSKKPMFMFIHYWDTHFPYNSTLDFLERAYSFIEKENVEYKVNLSEIAKNQCSLYFKQMFLRFSRMGLDIADLVARYYAAIAYVDHHIGRLLEALDDAGILDNTIIVLTADHGESLTAHEIYFDHRNAYDDIIHVPLIIKYPGSRSLKIDDIVQHTLVAPAIIRVIQGFNSGFSFDDNLWSLYKQNSALIYSPSFTGFRIAIRDMTYKYIVGLSENLNRCLICGKMHFPMKELYNVVNDPFEESNIANSFPNISKYYHLLLQKEILKMRRKSIQNRILMRTWRARAKILSR
jgi:arylsulfatase A-like enzyme